MCQRREAKFAPHFISDGSNECKPHAYAWCLGHSWMSRLAGARGGQIVGDLWSAGLVLRLPTTGANVAMHKKYSIGEVARFAQLNVTAIRYYEEIGLLPAAKRQDNNRRAFDSSDIRRVKFIRRARELVFDLAAIRQLLALAGLPDDPCEGADEIARGRLAEVEQKIARLEALRRELQAMTEQGAHGRIRECRVMEVLAVDDDLYV